MSNDTEQFINRLLGIKGHETSPYGQGSYDGDACRVCSWQGSPNTGKNHTEDTRRAVFADTFNKWYTERTETPTPVDGPGPEQPVSVRRLLAILDEVDAHSPDHARTHFPMCHIWHSRCLVNKIRKELTDE